MSKLTKLTEATKDYLSYTNVAPNKCEDCIFSVKKEEYGGGPDSHDQYYCTFSSLVEFKISANGRCNKFSTKKKEVKSE